MYGLSFILNSSTFVELMISFRLFESEFYLLVNYTSVVSYFVFDFRSSYFLLLLEASVGTSAGTSSLKI